MAKVLGTIKRNDDSMDKQEAELKRNINPEAIEPLEFENKEQERSLADLKQANMVEDDKNNPFDRWDESEKTPEYLESCMDYTNSKMSDKNADIDGYYDKLSEHFGKKDESEDESDMEDELAANIDAMAPGAETVNMTPEQKQFDTEAYQAAMRRWVLLQQQYDEYQKAKEDSYYDEFYAGKSYNGKDLVQETAKTGDSFVDSAVAETGKPVAEDAPEAPDAKEYEKDMEAQANPNEPAGQLQSVESEIKTEEQVQAKSSQNDAVSALMAKYEADSAAYERQQKEYEDIQTPLEKSMKRYC